MAVTRLSDLYEPTVFDETASKEDTFALALGNVLVEDPRISALLAEGSRTYELPSYNDFDTTASQIGTDDTTGVTPMNVDTSVEVGARFIRTASWSASRIGAVLAAADPMGEMTKKVGRYWAYQKQSILMSLITGVCADNADDGDDYTLDLSTLNSSTYLNGVTNWTAESFVDACQLMGDAQGVLGAIFMHSAVYARVKKNELIDVRQDSLLGDVEFYHGRRLFVDDRMPYSGGVAHSYVFGPGFIRYGEKPWNPPSEIWYDPRSGTGTGDEILITRRMFSIHPAGHTFTATLGSIAAGGPAEGTSANQLGHAGTWNRVETDRKRVPFVRIISREAAA